MKKAILLLADGFEEIEALAVVDILRRAEIEVAVTGLHDDFIKSARGVKIIPDITIDMLKFENYDMVILPGGQPGTNNLNADSRVKNIITHFNQQNKWISAICSAVLVLADSGILDKKHVTSFPSVKNNLGSVIYEEKSVVIDNNIITGRGPGSAYLFAYTIVEKLCNKEISDNIKKAMLYQS